MIATHEQFANIGYVRLNHGRGWNEERGIRTYNSALKSDNIATIKRGALVIATQIGRGKYKLEKAVDSNHKAYRPEELTDFEDLGELMTFLINPRFFEMSRPAAKTLVKIATAPFQESVDSLSSKVEEYISKENDLGKKAVLEIEFDNAMMAHDNGKPENYLRLYKNYTLGTS